MKMRLLVFSAPENIPAPVLFVLSDTSLRVTWIAPSKPNGNITTFNIIVNGNTKPTGTTQPGSMVITNLVPYTVYEIQVHFLLDFFVFYCNVCCFMKKKT
jgi:hypothetical protein